MLSTIKDLREIARCCNEGRQLNDRLARWLGRSLGDFLAHRTHTLDDALGLRSARGGVPWWQEEAMRQRNAFLRELRQNFFSHESLSGQARQIYVLAVRYASSAWRFDRNQDVLPAVYRDTPKEFLWNAFKSGAPMPIGERQLRTILAQEKRDLEHSRQPARQGGSGSECFSILP